MSEAGVKIDVLARNHYVFVLMCYYAGKMLDNEPTSLLPGVRSSVEHMFNVAVDTYKNPNTGSPEALTTVRMLEDLSDVAEEKKEQEIKDLAQIVFSLGKIKPTTEELSKLKRFFVRAESQAAEYSGGHSGNSEYTYTH